MKQKIKNKNKGTKHVKIRVIKAPLVNTRELKQIVMSRANALVL